MDTKLINLLLSIAVWVFLNIIVLAQSPTVSDVTFTQRIDGTHIVDIYYDVNDPNGDVMTVTMQASDDNGVTWNFTCLQISGDVGAGIMSGTTKHIVWNFGAEHPNKFDDQFRIKIIATDSLVMGISCPGTPTVTYEGKSYNTVQIGEQCWLKENLDVGTMILGNQNQTNNSTIEKYCYNNDPNNCTVYGGLYQWNEAMQYVTLDSSQGICPPGWHIPSYSEFQVLSSNVNGNGNALKAIEQGISGGAGTNSSGFSALLAGYRSYDTSFVSYGVDANFWSSREVPGQDAYNLRLDGYDSIMYLGSSYYIGYGFGIRCIKDETPIVQSCPSIPTITYEGKTYNTVQIGDQCWLKENLDVGTRIDGIQNSTNNGVIEKYCYDNDINNCNTYGGLYQWNEAMQYDTNEGAQGICPEGWHIPTLAEFQTLASTVNNDGNSLKAVGQGTGSGAGTNTSGFSGLFAGDRNPGGGYYNLNIKAGFWNSTEFDVNNAYRLWLYDTNQSINIYHLAKTIGYSVRCIKD